MEKQTKKDKKVLVIIVLLILLGVAVGYAALSQTLTINGTARISSEWNVLFKSITLGDSSGATQAEASPSKTSDTEVTFDVTLEKPGSYAEYTIVVENAGSIKAKLEKISTKTTLEEAVEAINAQEPADIVYTVTGDDVGSELGSKATTTYKVRVEWLSTSEEIPATKSKTATITLDYVQAD